MKKTVEMKIYEFLGVKKFKKMVLALDYITFIPVTREMTKEESKQHIRSVKSNYHIGSVKNLEDIRKFKKMLILNAVPHIVSFYYSLKVILLAIHSAIPLLTITLSFWAIIQAYCVMLQRYNGIRINQSIKEAIHLQEERKDKVKAEIRTKNELLNKHVYKLVDKHGLETNITLEEFMNTASLEQLKKYREYLQNMNQQIQEDITFSEASLCCMPIERGKYLKLEFPNKQ